MKFPGLRPVSEARIQQYQAMADSGVNLEENGLGIAMPSIAGRGRKSPFWHHYC
jgi:hypothetical protein